MNCVPVLDNRIQSVVFQCYITVYKHDGNEGNLWITLQYSCTQVSDVRKTVTNIHDDMSDMKLKVAQLVCLSSCFGFLIVHIDIF